MSKEVLVDNKQDLKVRAENNLPSNVELYNQYNKCGRNIRLVAARHEVSMTEMRERVSKGKESVTGKPLRTFKFSSEKAPRKVLEKNDKGYKNKSAAILKILYDNGNKDALKTLLESFIKRNKNSLTATSTDLGISTGLLARYRKEFNIEVPDYRIEALKKARAAKKTSKKASRVITMEAQIRKLRREKEELKKQILNQ